MAEINDFIINKSVFHIDAREVVDSTNTTLRELADKGAQEGYVVVAYGQTAGKGRQGRGFHSPAGHGAYFSLLLRPGYAASDAALITSAAAVAAARAIESVFNIQVGIKWVNDLFVSGKKVCGILTEAAFNMERGQIESAVLGIGINITMPEGGFPKELENIATALTDRQSGDGSGRCRLIAAVLDNFWGYYIDLSKRTFLDEYRERSIVLGHDIHILSNNGSRPASAISINDDCKLVVRYENGEIAILNSGEVSVIRKDSASIETM